MAKTPAKAADKGADPTLSPEFFRFIAATYKDDFNGYRRDILGMKPADWQDRVGEDLMNYRRVAVAAGHGIGKTAFAAAAIHWFISTRPNPAIVATANTETQLRTKLWRELNKVNKGAKNAAWFDWSQDRFAMLGDPTASALAIPWAEHNAEAFAGTHEEHVLGVFDEASAIPKVIWTTFSGAMSTPGARWLALGNSTRAEGYFHDVCHGKLRWRRAGDEYRGLWKSHVIPSTASPFVDPAWVEEMRLSLGEDSDDFRVRVLGLPPRFSADQYIPAGLVKQAMERKVDVFRRWPLILGVDVGHVNDRSVIVPRRGKVVLDRVARVQGMRTTDFARKIAEEIHYWRDEHDLDPEVVIEAVGMGVGVVETLEDMGYENIHGIHPGANATDPDLYLNLRAEMWHSMKEWFEDQVMVPNDPELAEDLAIVNRKPSATSKLQIESKDEIRRKGNRSPDVADALALTFALDFDLLPERRDEPGSAWGRYGYRPVFGGHDELGWM